jgi:hypothetical protein
VPDPQLPHEDWVITRPRLTGICGSDSALEHWRDAFLAIANQGESGAIKVVIDQR